MEVTGIRPQHTSGITWHITLAVTSWPSVLFWIWTNRIVLDFLVWIFFLFGLFGLFWFSDFSKIWKEIDPNSKQPGHDLLYDRNKQDSGFFRLPSAFHSILEELVKENRNKGKRHENGWLAHFYDAWEAQENSQKCCSSDGCLRRAKKLNAVYGLNWANFQLLRFILNIQVQLP